MRGDTYVRGMTMQEEKEECNMLVFKALRDKIKVTGRVEEMERAILEHNHILGVNSAIMVTSDDTADDIKRKYKQACDNIDRELGKGVGIHRICRITGYLSDVNMWVDSKVQEETMRVKHIRV